MLINNDGGPTPQCWLIVVIIDCGGFIKVWCHTITIQGMDPLHLLTNIQVTFLHLNNEVLVPSTTINVKGLTIS